MPFLSRRSVLQTLASTLVLGRASLVMANAPTERRFVVVILRGALDGLSAVVPYGDPALADLRGALVPPLPGAEDGMLDLGGFYALHPALAALHAMYQAGEALALHAVAGPYRVRSHFEAQDCLECGSDHRVPDGWLNRALAAMSVPDPAADALAVGVSLPLLLRGRVRVANWAPQGFAALDADLYTRIATLNRPDGVLGPAIEAGLRERSFATTVMSGAPPPGSDPYAFPSLAKAAGEMLRAEAGPRIAVMELGGWDTHAAQAQRLPPVLRQLDAGLAALRDALDAAWRRTAVLTITEFGRTVRMNGTNGTDHGTASVAFLAGGAVAGGRVIADWPGLGPSRLLEDRDLQPTLDLRAVAKGVLQQHLGLDASALASVFPDSVMAPPVSALIRTD